MAEGKKSFVLYTKYKDSILDLSDEEAGMLIKTIFRYVTDENPEIPKEIKQTFNILKADLKADLVKWEETKQKRVLAGQLGGLAKSSNSKQNVANVANARNDKQDLANVAVYDNVNVNDNVSKDNKENIRVINNTIKENTPNSRFSKPSVEEIKAYCDERGNGIDPNEFYDFYESKNWFVGKNKMKDWKACIRTWERKRGFKPGDSDDGEKIEIINGKKYVAGFEML